MKYWPFLPLFFLLQAMRPAHPLKMCVCDVKYQSETDRLKLRFKFFHDDLEAVLEKQTGRNLTLTRISPENDRLLTDFINRQFDLKINQTAIKLRHLHTEVQDVMLVVEFAGDSFKSAPDYCIDLSNQILLDVFPDQYNLVRFDFFGDGNLETMRFERAERRLVKQMGKRI